MLKILLSMCLAVWTAKTASAQPTGPQSEERTSLEYAMQKAILVDENIQTVKEILKKGFDVSQPIGCGSYTALHGAVEKRNKEMIKVLIDAGAKPDDTMMLEAFQSFDMETDIPNMLIAAGGDTTAYEHPYDTCLYSAVWHGNRPLVELILSQKKLDIDRAGERGTPLSLAILRGHIDIAKLLLAKGADAHKRGHDAQSISAAELIDVRLAELTELRRGIQAK